MRLLMGLSAVLLVTGFSVGSAHGSFVDAPFSRNSGDHWNDDNFGHDGYSGRSSYDEDDHDGHSWDHHEGSSRRSESSRPRDWDDEDEDHDQHCGDSTVCWALNKEDRSEHSKDHKHRDDEEEPCDDDTHHYPEDVGQVPLPGAAMLFGSGLVVVAASRRRRSKMRTLDCIEDKADTKKDPQFDA